MKSRNSGKKNSGIKIGYLKALSFRLSYIHASEIIAM